MITNRYAFSHAEDYKTNFIGSAIYSNNNAINTYGYNNGRAYLNVDETKYGWFSYKCYLKKGDIVRVRVNTYVLSGAFPRLGLYYENLNNAGKKIELNANYCTDILKYSYVCEQEGVYIVATGYATSDIGNCVFENLAIEISKNEKSIFVNTITDGEVHKYTLDASCYDQFEFYNGNGIQTTAEIVKIDGGLVGDTIKIVKGSTDLRLLLSTQNNIYGNFDTSISREHICTELIKVSKGVWIKKENEETSWMPLTLETGWTNIDETNTTEYVLQYKLKGNCVYIRGAIKQTVSSSNTLIATLPYNLKPKVGFISSFIATQNGATDKFLGLQIKSNQLLVRLGTLEVDKWISINIDYHID